MAPQGQGLTREFASGAVYAVLQLDGVPHMAGEVQTTELVPRPDGRFDVVYKASFPLPPRTQERITQVLTSHARVGEVRFEDFPVVRH